MKRTSIGIGLALGTLFTVGGGLALACEHGGKGVSDGKRGEMHARFLQKFDTDGDGKLSPEERKAAHAAMLQRLDTNGDGVVSDEERAAARHAFAQKKLAKLDANGDGVISREEAASSRLGRHFDRVDADKSGTVTLPELETAMQKRMERHRKGA